MDIVWPSVGAIQRALLVLSKEDQIGGRGSYTYDDVASHYFSDSLVRAGG